ncbi:MAG: hypothetical protein CMI53_04865 [Parcubacteria group bacterium]|nr:hypothetical protein [Parcubacteria group bacterium]|tara:strand:- start:15670 stop:18441 length:2772 start_codon:yes stop_codon:yes gene_type:complete
MPKEKVQQQKLQILKCEHCTGSGLVQKRVCDFCLGFGMLAWTGDELLYWNKRINLVQIGKDRVKLLVTNFINLSLFLFGTLGVLMLGWVMVSFIETDFLFWKFYKIRNWQMTIFWLSMLTNGYLVYRFQKAWDKIKFIPKQKYQTTNVPFRKISWSEVKDLPKNKKINITDYFTIEAQTAVNKSWQLTNRYEDNQTDPIHLLIALLTYNQTQVIFARLGVPFSKLKSKIRNTLSAQPEHNKGMVILSTQMKEIIFRSYFLARQLRQKKVEITELLEELVTQDNKVNELLYDLNITVDKIRNVTAWLRIKQQLRDNLKRFKQKATLRPRSSMNRAMTAVAIPTLDTFSQDLTLLAQTGYLLPCIGRDKEIEEIFNIMHGGTRRSVILIGQPGVGKNTIIDGIAQRMVEDNVPDFLKDKRLVNLSVAKIVSGATPVEAQKRLMTVIHEIRRSGNIILFIENVDKMIGISAGRQGSIDLADVLSQTLSNNNLLALATTTPDDYRKYFEGKSSLDNVFEKVDITEVSGNEAIQILEAKAGSVEYQNEVFFSYDAIAQTVNLSDRYLHERYLPEKAIEIIQEVATKVKQEKGKDSTVTANDVATVISNKTNIPLTEITQEESKKLLNLEDKIHQRVIGQDEAVTAVAASIRRARAEMRDTSKPIVNLLFLGPTGVGKTELAKSVAEVYFGNEKNMIRLDMSEYQDKTSINRLIGAPPGYSGAGEGGYLSEAVRKKQFSLILLDEIEKAHPDILNIFLQVLDDGRLTDSSGRTIDFTNTIIIATSNAGTRFIQDQVKQKMPIGEIKQQLIDSKLGKFFRPELLNRFDGIIVFKPLTLDGVEKIAQLMIKKVGKTLEEKGITLDASDEAVKEIATAGFDPQFGARPLRRVIQQKVQDPLANYLLSGKIDRRDKVMIEAGGEISIKKAKKI